MDVARAVYVPWLHMHQPLIWYKGSLTGNLEKMLDEGIYDAKKMARAYNNPALYVRKLSRYNPKIMLDFSGTLLESLERLSQNGTLDTTTVFVDREGTEQPIGNFLSLYREVLTSYPHSMEWAGTGYYHPYFPALPRADYGAHIARWRETFSRLFGPTLLKRVRGFWLPEMGIPGEPDLYYLIEEIKAHGYQWLILPAVNDLAKVPIVPRKGQKLTRFELINEPHVLVAKNEKGEETRIVAVVREPEIDQQAGCGAQGVYEKAQWVAANMPKKHTFAPLVVPTGDGENGNVMMNEFFPVTFEPFFTTYRGREVESMLISEYLDYELKQRRETFENASFSEVEITQQGGSWIGGHQQWLVGERRLQIVQEIHRLSAALHSMKDKHTKQWNNAYTALLIAETSCYVYWGSDFWFDQAFETLALVRTLMRKI